jgi:hypothetical protein
MSAAVGELAGLFFGTWAGFGSFTKAVEGHKRNTRTVRTDHGR